MFREDCRLNYGDASAEIVSKLVARLEHRQILGTHKDISFEPQKIHHRVGIAAVLQSERVTKFVYGRHEQIAG